MIHKSFTAHLKECSLPVNTTYGNTTHRRLRLPKVTQFRDWFGHIPHSTFRVINFRGWFGVSCLYCTLKSTLETTFRVLKLVIGYSFMAVTKPISEPEKTKEPGRNTTYLL